MNVVTITDVIAMRPCPRYTEEHLQKIFGRRKSLSYCQIAAHKAISHADKVWFLLRRISIKFRVLWACDVAEDVLKLWQNYAKDDNRPAEAICLARICAKNPTPKNRAAARAAAYAAAEAAAYTAYAAAYAAARAAVEKKQLTRLLEYVKKEEAPDDEGE